MLSSMEHKSPEGHNSTTKEIIAQKEAIVAVQGYAVYSLKLFKIVEMHARQMISGILFEVLLVGPPNTIYNPKCHKQ